MFPHGVSPPPNEGDKDIPKEPSSSSSSRSTGSTNIAGHSFAENSSKKFQDVDIQKILVVEGFAGTGRLTSALRDKGFKTMAVDTDRSRTKQVHIVQYDLEDRFHLEALLQLLDKERQSILWVHFAPSCGTASRSRERPLKHLEKLGFDVPKPLRSNQHPMGAPGLSGKDLAKVLSANATYEAMLRVCKQCLLADIAISIEIQVIRYFGRFLRYNSFFVKQLVLMQFSIIVSWWFEGQTHKMVGVG